MTKFSLVYIKLRKISILKAHKLTLSWSQSKDCLLSAIIPVLTFWCYDVLSFTKWQWEQIATASWQHTHTHIHTHTHTHTDKGQLYNCPKVVDLFFNLLDHKISRLRNHWARWSQLPLSCKLYVALHSTTNNIFALGLLAGTRTWSKIM